jgi:hypothetical protein
VISATAAKAIVRYRRKPNGRRDRVAGVGCPIVVASLTMRESLSVP